MASQFYHPPMNEVNEFVLVDILQSVSPARNLIKKLRLTEKALNEKLKIIIIDFSSN